MTEKEREKLMKDADCPKARPDENWSSELDPLAHKVLREKGTERAFTGKLLHNDRNGTYVCAGCRNRLFPSDTKFDSGSGWPSFWAPIDKNSVAERPESGFLLRRTEVLCARCGGHLGHVFNDGPEPTGMRYCINSAALEFKEGKDG